MSALASTIASARVWKGLFQSSRFMTASDRGETSLASMRA